MLGGRVVWKKRIRPDALARSKERCNVCAAKAEKLLCHDKWVYDDKKAIAMLAGFEMHCELCKVNKCDEKAALTILTDAHKKWGKRNEKTWKIGVAPELLESYPELEGLPEFKPSVSL
jgi:hypothetical protein